MHFIFIVNTKEPFEKPFDYYNNGFSKINLSIKITIINFYFRVTRSLIEQKNEYCFYLKIKVIFLILCIYRDLLILYKI